MAVKIAITNQKGGVGKTTTAICLAQELIRRDYKVLFIDTDAQCNSTDFYEAKTENEATLLDILCGDEPAAECIQTTKKGDIIPADKQLKDAENMVKVDERRFIHLKKSCKAIDKKYDYIIIDTPPIIGVCLKNVLQMADYVIIPVDESGWSLAGMIDFADAIELAQDGNDHLKVAGVLTIKAKQRTKKSGRMTGYADSVAEKLESIHFKTKIRESVACAEALTEYSEPLHLYAPKSTTCIDYAAFTDELLKEIGGNK